jgi:hypothetical protein
LKEKREGQKAISLSFEKDMPPKILSNLIQHDRAYRIKK